MNDTDSKTLCIVDIAYDNLSKNVAHTKTIMSMYKDRPFNVCFKMFFFCVQDPVALAKAVLAEVPKQCVDYFKSQGIRPGNE